MLEAVTAPSTPTWVYVISSIGSAISAIAIVIGGGFAYMKFARGRLLHTWIDSDVQVSELEIEGTPALLISATVSNAGTLRVTFPADMSQRLELTLADRLLWRDACSAKQRELLWSDGVHCYDQDLLVVEGKRETNPNPKKPDPSLEPGERLPRTVLVPLPAGEWAAYRAQLTVTARPDLIWRRGRPDSWKTEVVAAAIGQSDDD